MPKRKKKKEYVVDSHAILTYLQAGEGWQELGRLLRFWKRKGIFARLNWINWGEIYYTIHRHFGKEKAQEAMDFVAAYPVTLEPIDLSLVESAAELKATYSFAYADAFCAATALKYDAVLVTGDPELRQIEGRIQIRWIK
ncbi:MAG TPA: type II toxin-antitoxin system VapC family toxin [Acidobacteriota bacterium]|nr:type II toxin-antitoxin system VapC family toxin [Acidobacteriota bacterium]